MDYVQQMQKTMSAAPGRTFYNDNNSNSTPSLSSDIQQLREQLQTQKDFFERIQQVNKNRIATLEKEVSELREGLLKVKEFYDKVRDKQIVEQTREAVFNHRDRPPVDRPIDRNNVAPADVAISKIFNFSGRKF